MQNKKAFMCIFIYLLVAGPVFAQSDLLLYENFNTNIINPDKWFGSDFQRGNTIRESIRKIDGNRLRLAAIGYGMVGGDLKEYEGMNQLVFNSTNPIESVRFSTRVIKFYGRSCSDGSYSYANARFKGYYFNSGENPPASDSRVDDVVVSIRVQGKSNRPGWLDVTAKISKCTNADCSEDSIVYSDTLSTILLGRTIRLGVDWDKEGDRFVFWYGDESKTFSYSGILSDNFPLSPLSEYHNCLTATVLMPSCADGPAPMAFIDAFFDDVYVKEFDALLP
jgi:hypothetical protein